jgi:lipopolysaccharide transport system permease protein
VVVVALAIYFGPIQGVFYVSMDWNMLAVVPACLLTLLLALGVGCFLSILNAFARDTQLTLRYALSFWMLATPIVYPIDLIPEPYHWVLYLNPMAPVVELFRWGVLGYGAVNWVYVGVATTEILALLLLGIKFFAKMQNRLFDHM